MCCSTYYYMSSSASGKIKWIMCSDWQRMLAAKKDEANIHPSWPPAWSIMHIIYTVSSTYLILTGSCAPSTLIFMATSISALVVIFRIRLQFETMSNSEWNIFFLHSQASGALTVAAFMQEVLTNPLSVCWIFVLFKAHGLYNLEKVLNFSSCL